MMMGRTNNHYHLLRLCFVVSCLIVASLPSCSAFGIRPTKVSITTLQERTHRQLYYQSFDDEDEYLYYRQAPLNENETFLQDLTNQFLKASRDSFKNVESCTDFLLEEKPLVALLIFVGAGLLVAYICGFFILCGYIDSLNPAANNAVPYWD